MVIRDGNLESCLLSVPCVFGMRFNSQWKTKIEFKIRLLSVAQTSTEIDKPQMAIETVRLQVKVLQCSSVFVQRRAGGSGHFVIYRKPLSRLWWRKFICFVSWCVVYLYGSVPSHLKDIHLLQICVYLDAFLLRILFMLCLLSVKYNAYTQTYNPSLSIDQAFEGFSFTCKGRIKICKPCYFRSIGRLLFGCSHISLHTHANTFLDWRILLHQG